MLNTKKRIENKIMYISLEGRLDSNTVPSFDDELRAMYSGLDGIIFDLAGLEYISSAGLRVLLRAKKSVGNVTVINANDSVTHVFELTGFDQTLNLQK